MSNTPNISLPSGLKKWADGRAARKGFESADELVADMIRREQANAAREKLEDDLSEAVKGPFTPVTAKYWNEIRAEGRKRARERRKK
jgi:hypothetical protein